MWHAQHHLSTDPFGLSILGQRSGNILSRNQICVLAAWACLCLGLGKRVPGLMSLSSDQATPLTLDSSAASPLLPHHRLSLPVPALQQLGLAGPSSAGPMGSLVLLWEESLIITGGREGGGRAEAPHHAFPHPCRGLSTFYECSIWTFQITMILV